MILENSDFFDGHPSLFRHHFLNYHKEYYKKVDFLPIANYANHAKMGNNLCNSYLFQCQNTMAQQFPVMPIHYGKMPGYPNAPLWLILLKPVKKNDQIMFDYGWDAATCLRFNVPI